MVLSGMSDLRQVEDNIAFMRDFKPLDETELAAVKRVQEIFRSKSLIPCTACRYCTAGCPQHISIPDLFAVMNAKQIHRDWNADYYYDETYTKSGGRASDCIRCGKCEKVCPQHLHIRDLLADVAAEFEKRAEHIALSPAFRISELPQARQGTSRWRAFRRLRTGDRNTDPRRRGCRAPR